VVVVVGRFGGGRFNDGSDGGVGTFTGGVGTVGCGVIGGVFNDGSDGGVEDGVVGGVGTFTGEIGGEIGMTRIY